MKQILLVCSVFFFSSLSFAASKVSKVETLRVEFSEQDLDAWIGAFLKPQRGDSEWHMRPGQGLWMFIEIEHAPNDTVSSLGGFEVDPLKIKTEETDSQFSFDLSGDQAKEVFGLMKTPAVKDRLEETKVVASQAFKVECTKTLGFIPEYACSFVVFKE